MRPDTVGRVSTIFTSSEHKVLKVSYCDLPLFGVFSCVFNSFVK